MKLCCRHANTTVCVFDFGGKSIYVVVLLQKHNVIKTYIIYFSLHILET